MSRNVVGRRSVAVVLAATMWTAIAAGCAQEREPINRVQANVLPKSFFVGAINDHSDDPEFYYRATVTDAAAGAGNDGLFTSSDAQPTSRIRWEVTENMLIGRLTYELIENTDHKGLRRTPDGQVVVAFRIEKHFDIRREYNEATGEELNVIVENDTDRPWHAREYFRVDFSQNLVTDAYDVDAVSQLGIYYGVKFEPLAYYVNEPGHPDAPVFEDKDGYLDVTTKLYAAPEIIHDPEWGDFPACWLIGEWPALSCNPSEVTLRLSFMKVVDHDYEPWHVDGTRMDMFGWFTVDRFGYDRSYGVVDDRWHRFASRWNIYDKSHVDPVVKCATPETTPVGASVHRDENGDGTEDECELVGRGSRCDEFRGECTIPMRDRKIKTIVWHVNQGAPADLFEGSMEALDGWSDAIRIAVVAARVTECRRTGGADCEQEMGWPVPFHDEYRPPIGNASPAEVPKIFVLCHNPVDPVLDDTSLCGEAGLSPRLGDLRYNIVNIIDAPQITGPWGIMMDAEDPLTGEKIAGSVNEWSAVLDRAATTLVDLLGLINGTVDPSSYIAGEHVEDWVAANRPGGVAERGAPMSEEEAAARKHAYDPGVVERYLEGLPGAGGKQGRREHPAVRRKARTEALIDSSRLGPGNAALTARLRRLRGTETEAAMFSPELTQLAGFDPTVAPTKEAIERGSPFGRANPIFRRDRDRSARLAHANRHGCRIDGPEPDSLLGMARLAAHLFPAPDLDDKAAVIEHRQRVLLWARQQYHKGVIAHELGHSMGLRHNFAATFDSLNYRPQYWQLRTRNGNVTASCAEGTVDGTDCIGPRWRDPITVEEVANSIGRFATTSVMDYPGDENHDQLMQGKYDRAAMRFGYGGVVDVWSQEGLSVHGVGDGKATAYRLSAFTTSPGLFGIFYFPPPDPTAPYEFIHYSEYQNKFGLLRNCRPDDGPDAMLGQKCDEPPMDVVDYRDMQDFASDPAYAEFSWALNAKAVDGAGRVRRGYMFSSDEYADSGNVPSFTYDAGADPYEQIRFLESAYENRYILDSFRRERVQFNSWDTTARIQAHYLDAIQLIAKTFAFGAILDGDPTKPSSELLQDGYYGPMAMGATVALDMFARIMTRPEPGLYCTAWDCSYTGQPYGVLEDIYVADPVPLPEQYPGLYEFEIPLGPGRYVHNDFDYSQGYFWSDYQTQVGSYYEKIWATFYLAEAYDFFLSNSKEDFTDGRYKNVSFATIFPEQVRRLYGSLFTGDLESYAPWVVPTAGQDIPPASVEYPRWFDASGPMARPSNARLLDPNNAFNEQLFGMVWGSVFFPTNWSQSWINEARIAVFASDQVDWPDHETYAFRDPESGMTYKAHAVGTENMVGKQVQRGVGARMLEWANWLAYVAYLVEVDPQGNPVTNPDGTLNYVLGSDGRPQPDPSTPGADGVLRKYVDNLDIMRQLTSEFSRPLGDADLPDP